MDDYGCLEGFALNDDERSNTIIGSKGFYQEEGVADDINLSVNGNSAIKDSVEALVGKEADGGIKRKGMIFTCYITNLLKSEIKAWVFPAQFFLILFAMTFWNPGGRI